MRLALRDATRLMAKKSIKVEFVLPVVGAHKLGGMEMLAANLLNRIDRSRFAGSLVCFDAQNGALDRIDKPSIPSSIIDKRDGIDPLLVPKLYSHFKNTRPDIVHTFNDGALIYAFPAAKMARVPVLVHAEHGRLPVPEKWLLRKIRLAMARRAQAVVVVSDALRELVSDEGVPEHKLVTLVNGVDLETFSGGHDRVELRQKWGLSDTDLVVGTVGSLTPQKNHKMLIEAAALIPYIKVLIAGGGRLESSLNQLIEENHLENRVRCIGRIDDVPSFLSLLDVFALPSTTEGTSLALLEAMAARLTVVATDVGGNAKVVENGKTGFLTPAGDVNAFADKLKACTSDRDRCVVMGRFGRSKVESDFNFAHTVKAYEQLFERVMISHTEN